MLNWPSAWYVKRKLKKYALKLKSKLKTNCLICSYLVNAIRSTTMTRISKAVAPRVINYVGYYG